MEGINDTDENDDYDKRENENGDENTLRELMTSCGCFFSSKTTLRL